MSGYILCHEKKAARPYYIEAVGIRIWHHRGAVLLCEQLCVAAGQRLFLRGSVRLGGQAASDAPACQASLCGVLPGKIPAEFYGDPADQHRVLHPGGDRAADPVSGRHGACVGDGAAETERRLFSGRPEIPPGHRHVQPDPGDAQKPGADR